MSERTIKSDGAEICTQAFGDPKDPPVLLIMGVLASMLWWPERFCEELAGQGRFVIRYDNRDTGLSTHWPQGEPGYRFADMADDAAAVLDGYGIAKAHVVGMSMGGMLVQQLALRHPDRVRTVTIISSSPLGVEGLPGMTPAYSAHSAEGEKVDWSDVAAMADYIRKDVAMIASTRHPHDVVAASELIDRDVARTGSSYTSSTNHFALLGDDGPKLRAADIAAPMLVIHGTSDPLFPVEHGEAFLKELPEAKLHRIEGGGHEIHSADIDEYVRIIAGFAV
jgi:pimeloyl-ACP methyl ester carboxylesterase